MSSLREVNGVVDKIYIYIYIYILMKNWANVLVWDSEAKKFWTKHRLDVRFSYVETEAQRRRMTVQVNAPDKRYCQFSELTITPVFSNFLLSCLAMIYVSYCEGIPDPQIGIQPIQRCFTIPLPRQASQWLCTSKLFSTFKKKNIISFLWRFHGM